MIIISVHNTLNCHSDASYTQACEKCEILGWNTVFPRSDAVATIIFSVRGRLFKGSVYSRAAAIISCRWRPELLW